MALLVQRIAAACRVGASSLDGLAAIQTDDVEDLLADIGPIELPRAQRIACDIATSFGGTAQMMLRQDARTIPLMMTPAAKRKAVARLKDAFGMSGRRACKAIGCCRMRVATRPAVRTARFASG